MAEMDCLNNEDEISSILDNASQVDSQMESESEISTQFENVIEISKTYYGDETNDIIVNVDNTNNTISATLKKMWFTSAKEFPAIGSDNLIYVDLSTEGIYSWDSEHARYNKIVSSWRDIEEINGGNA